MKKEIEEKMKQIATLSKELDNPVMNIISIGNNKVHMTHTSFEETFGTEGRVDESSDNFKYAQYSTDYCGVNFFCLVKRCEMLRCIDCDKIECEDAKRRVNDMICKCCKYEYFEKYNGSPNRYYCIHPAAAESVNAGERMISRTERHSDERKHRTAPKWCPLKEVKLNEKSNI